LVSVEPDEPDIRGPRPTSSSPGPSWFPATSRRQRVAPGTGTGAVIWSGHGILPVQAVLFPTVSVEHGREAG
jgi:hypothetical protein